MNERLQLEEAYARLTAAKVEKSKNWVKDTLASAGQDALKEVAKGIFLGSAKLLIKEMSPTLAENAFGKPKAVLKAATDK